jgi:hypothetical protein
VSVLAKYLSDGVEYKGDGITIMEWTATGGDGKEEQRALTLVKYTSKTILSYSQDHQKEPPCTGKMSVSKFFLRMQDKFAGCDDLISAIRKTFPRDKDYEIEPSGAGDTEDVDTSVWDGGTPPVCAVSFERSVSPLESECTEDAQRESMSRAAELLTTIDGERGDHAASKRQRVDDESTCSQVGVNPPPMAQASEPTTGDLSLVAPPIDQAETAYGAVTAADAATAMVPSTAAAEMPPPPPPPQSPSILTTVEQWHLVEAAGTLVGQKIQEAEAAEKAAFQRHRDRLEANISIDDGRGMKRVYEEAVALAKRDVPGRRELDDVNTAIDAIDESIKFVVDWYKKNKPA